MQFSYMCLKGWRKRYKMDLSKQRWVKGEPFEWYKDEIPTSLKIAIRVSHWCHQTGRAFQLRSYRVCLLRWFY